MKQMNRVTKIVMAFTLASATVLSVIPVFASNETVTLSQDIPTLDVDYEYKNESFLGTTYKNNFYIEPHYGWAKIWIHNTSSDTVTVRVSQNTLTGKEKMLFTLAPGEQLAKKGIKPWSTGTHWISIAPKTGKPVSGLLTVKLAKTKDQL